MAGRVESEAGKKLTRNPHRITLTQEQSADINRRLERFAKRAERKSWWQRVKAKLGM